ncbi:hypothetical protein CEW88_19615 (plasmid) [Alloyangia pacifica]|uniref:Biosynthetic protein, Pnap_2097 family n=1 Tax=Alloyangia pacifica TaxID=311180 RepID=A0A2U8HJF9_9RHOB|nr:Pnap_2097 family protein [Alloyangia pacifica]AWI85974.1 hypothetical protein CEW88_19615 [Alloyangia pacifica]
MLDVDTTGVGVLTRQRLGMQQLSPHGLSETWALGFCGDIHWQLLAATLGQEEFGFRTADGRPIYAAFCATRIELPRSRDLLGAELDIRSRLASLGGACIGSRHEFRQGGQVIGSLLMLSTFVTHDETGSNRRIVRAMPERDCMLPEAGVELKELDARARSVLRTLRGQRVDEGVRLTPSPSLDFNAVGLLYFVSFTRLAESVSNSVDRVRAREIIYLGNLDQGETVKVLQNGTEALVAREDGKIIAHVTVAREAQCHSLALEERTEAPGTQIQPEERR